MESDPPSIFVPTKTTTITLPTTNQATPKKHKKRAWEKEDVGSVREAIQLTPRKESISETVRDVLVNTPPSVKDKYGQKNTESKIRRELVKAREETFETVLHPCLMNTRRLKSGGSGWEAKDENSLYLLIKEDLWKTARGGIAKKEKVMSKDNMKKWLLHEPLKHVTAQRMRTKITTWLNRLCIYLEEHEGAHSDEYHSSTQ